MDARTALPIAYPAEISSRSARSFAISARSSSISPMLCIIANVAVKHACVSRDLSLGDQGESLTNAEVDSSSLTVPMLLKGDAEDESGALTVLENEFRFDVSTHVDSSNAPRRPIGRDIGLRLLRPIFNFVERSASSAKSSRALSDRVDLHANQHGDNQWLNPGSHTPDKFTLVQERQSWAQ